MNRSVSNTLLMLFIFQLRVWKVLFFSFLYFWFQPWWWKDFSIGCKHKPTQQNCKEKISKHVWDIINACFINADLPKHDGAIMWLVQSPVAPCLIATFVFLLLSLIKATGHPVAQVLLFIWLFYLFINEYESFTYKSSTNYSLNTQNRIVCSQTLNKWKISCY